MASKVVEDKVKILLKASENVPHGNVEVRGAYTFVIQGNEVIPYNKCAVCREPTERKCKCGYIRFCSPECEAEHKTHHKVCGQFAEYASDRLNDVKAALTIAYASHKLPYPGKVTIDFREGKHDIKQEATDIVCVVILYDEFIALTESFPNKDKSMPKPTPKFGIRRKN